MSQYIWKRHLASDSYYLWNWSILIWILTYIYTIYYSSDSKWSNQFILRIILIWATFTHVSLQGHWLHVATVEVRSCGKQAGKAGKSLLHCWRNWKRSYSGEWGEGQEKGLNRRKGTGIEDSPSLAPSLFPTQKRINYIRRYCVSNKPQPVLLPLIAMYAVSMINVVHLHLWISPGIF